MPRFAVNLSLLFTEHPLPERFAHARKAGFDAVEIQFPYDYPAIQLRQAADEAGVRIILINLPAGDLMSGGFGLASHPLRTSTFLTALQQADEYASVLGVSLVNVLAGRRDPDCDLDESWRCLAANLLQTAEHFARRDVRVCCEAINTYDMPGFIVATPEALDALLVEVAHPNAFMQLDIYHLARMAINIPEAISRYLPKIAHIQLADHPGRCEPGTGTLNINQIFDFIEKITYTGWCSAEYYPSGNSTDSFGWMRAPEGFLSHITALRN